MKRIIVIFAVLFAPLVWADQCLVLSKSEAQKAIQILQQGQRFHWYCQLCNDKSIQEFSLENVELINSSWPGEKKEDYRILVEGNFIQKQVDIAYIYVDGLNLGLSVGCEATGVDRLLPQK